MHKYHYLAIGLILTICVTVYTFVKMIGESHQMVLVELEKINKNQSEMENRIAALEKQEAVPPQPTVTVDPYDSRSFSIKYQINQSNRELRFGVKSTETKFNSAWLNWKGNKSAKSEDIRTIVKSVLKHLPHIKTNDAVVSLVTETAIVESKGGFYVTNRYGDCGMFQIKVRVANDQLGWLKNTHKDIYDAIMGFYNKKLSMKDNLISNIPFAAAVCVTEYWRKAGPDYHKHIESIEKRGVMWKSVYNTHKGYGTVNAYISRVNSFNI